MDHCYGAKATALKAVTGQAATLKFIVDALIRQSEVLPNTLITITQDYIDATQHEMDVLNEVQRPTECEACRSDFVDPQHDQAYSGRHHFNNARVESTPGV